MDSLVFTRKEMQEITGLSLPTIDALARRAQNPLPHIRVGARVLFPADALHLAQSRPASVAFVQGRLLPLFQLWRRRKLHRPCDEAVRPPALGSGAEAGKRLSVAY